MRGVSSSLLSTGRHGRFEQNSYCDYEWKYSATTKLHYNLQKETRGSGFVEEESLYKKISKKDVYVDYVTTADISQDAVNQAVWRYDSIEVSETNHYYSYVSQQPSFELLFCFLLGSDGDATLDFAFSFMFSHPVSATLSVSV